jgi:large subunit ribosomal protein L21
MYAVIVTGGKQYKVTEGDIIDVELLDAEGGAVVTFDKVLMVAEGEKVQVGSPVLEKAKVTAKVLGEERGPKLIHFHYRRRKDSRNKRGHRQDYHRVQIEKIKA